MLSGRKKRDYGQFIFIRQITPPATQEGQEPMTNRTSAILRMVFVLTAARMDCIIFYRSTHNKHILGGKKWK